MAKEVIKSTMFVVEIRRLVVLLLPPPPLDGAGGAALAVVDMYFVPSPWKMMLFVTIDTYYV